MSGDPKWTPGPWSHDVIQRVRGPDGLVIAACDYGPDDLSRANARRIVQCVNAHDELLEALTECEAAAGIAVQAFNETGNACPAAIGLSAERARRLLARIRREAP